MARDGVAVKDDLQILVENLGRVERALTQMAMDVRTTNVHAFATLRLYALICQEAGKRLAECSTPEAKD
jgi:hypothetical protein